MLDLLVCGQPLNREKELLIKCYLLNKFTDIGMAKFEMAT
ncbi:putative transposase [Wolbachia pipientis wVitA]|nr:putative transposase [Wolbachia pipientis wVitA]